jgi:hypothetical protein
MRDAVGATVPGLATVTTALADELRFVAESTTVTCAVNDPVEP